MTTTTSATTYEDMSAEYARLRAQMQPLGRSEILAPDGQEFSWGPVQGIHSISGFEIVEYLTDYSGLSNPSEHHVRRHGTPAFNTYIDGRSTSRSYLSLDSALVGAIATRRCGPNSQAAYHFDLMTLGTLPENR